MQSMLALVGRAIARYLTKPSRAPYVNLPTDLEAFRAIVRAGDVVLVDGRQRFSTAIKYLTQSTWSHAALCIGDDPSVPGWCPQFIEADVIDGVRIIPVDAFADHHVRICRPVGLDEKEIASICEFAIDRLGHGYDLRNVIDLARYLFPTPPVPAGWRRRMIALGSGEPTKAICSSLIAQAFQSVRYPILPVVTREMIDDPDCRDCIRDILHIRHHSLFVPRDFDVSPYFEVIKPTLNARFNPRTLRWAEVALDEHGRERAPVQALADARKGPSL
jgi:hypothetical protein